MTRTEPCLACGGTITADPAEPGPGVLAHIRGVRHTMWALGLRHGCRGCRAVTIPAWRDRCRWCSRAVAA